VAVSISLGYHVGVSRDRGEMMDDAVLRAVDNTIRFLRMSAIELRRLAERAPDVASELHHIADQLDADANDLEQAANPRRS
jgi:hypothetical protein